MVFSEMPENSTEILVEITKIGGKVDAIHNRFDKHEHDTTVMLNKHNEALYGNGRDGVITEVSNIQQWREAIKGKLKFWSGIVGTVLGVALIGYLGLK